MYIVVCSPSKRKCHMIIDLLYVTPFFLLFSYTQDCQNIEHVVSNHGNHNPRASSHATIIQFIIVWNCISFSVHGRFVCINSNNKSPFPDPPPIPPSPPRYYLSHSTPTCIRIGYRHTARMRICYYSSYSSV